MSGNTKHVEYGEGKATVTLSRPLSIDGTKVPKIVMREPTVRDEMLARKTAGDGTGNEIILLANLCGLSEEDMKNMPLKDYRRLQEVFLVFLE